VGHKDWHAVANLPGMRITRRVTGRGCRQFVDEGDVVVAQQEQSAISIGPIAYLLTKGGVQREGTEGVLISWPRGRSRVQGPRERWNHRVRIDVQDGPPLEFRLMLGAWSLRWNVAKIVDQSARTLVTLRWRAEDALGSGVFNRAEPKFKRLGEAVVAPNHACPVEPILFSCYSLEAFDRSSNHAQNPETD
jgi:hypothetical protein